MTALSAAAGAQVAAAQEFLKAGNHAGARQIVEQLAAEDLQHADVLEIRWELAAQDGNWELALELAKALGRLAPENEFAWMWQACSLNELNRTEEALDTLVLAFEKFPQSPTIPYNLACCSCRLKRLEDGWRWLTKAIEIGGRAEIKLMALDDPDLLPLLDQVCAL
ncbi:MAG: tetratricopeptide repeat protein [Verrucomicrobia bacterium]|nr:tetratricopeptide repeat protein [Verrucomicrobiota bacterium]